MHEQRYGLDIFQTAWISSCAGLLQGHMLQDEDILLCTPPDLTLSGFLVVHIGDYASSSK